MFGMSTNFLHGLLDAKNSRSLSSLISATQRTRDTWIISVSIEAAQTLICSCKGFGQFVSFETCTIFFRLGTMAEKKDNDDTFEITNQNFDIPEGEFAVYGTVRLQISTQVPQCNVL